MSYPRFLTLEELVNEVMDEEEEEEEDIELDGDVSDSDVPDLVVSGSEFEEEGNSSSSIDDTIGSTTCGDPLYTAKDGTFWRSEPCPTGRLGKENVINLRPGF